MLRKIMYTPANPSFTIWKWGLRGSKLYRYVFVMHTPDTWHDVPPSNFILTLERPVLIPSSSFLMLSAKRKSLKELFWKSLVWLVRGSNPQPPGHKADFLPTEPLCRLEYTINSSYLEFQGTLWNTSRYPYLDISELQNWGKNNSNNHI